MPVRERILGETIVGSERQQSGLVVNSAPATRGYVALMASSGVQFYFWVNTSGVLIMSTSLENVIAGSGTAVGAQT